MVMYVVEQAAQDSGKLADATVVTVGCSKEEFDKHHRIRPLEKDMEIMLTKVNLPGESAEIRSSLFWTSSSDTDCIWTFSLGFSVSTLRPFCRLRTTIWYCVISMMMDIRMVDIFQLFCLFLFVSVDFLSLLFWLCRGGHHFWHFLHNFYVTRDEWLCTNSRKEPASLYSAIY